ncbi:MAG: hypothetical protein WC760_05760 [Bacteroidia bacterium]
MLKIKLIGYFCIILTLDTFANVNFIDITKISSKQEHLLSFNYIKDNKQYYDHWTEKWTYAIPKQELIKNLRDKYNAFSALTDSNTELYLLLGDIAHYLYNLDDTIYFTKAVKYYNNAKKTDPKDYRSYWFLGFHYALSNVPIPAIDNFLTAEKLLPDNQPAEFWNDYAWTAAVTNMPSHCIYAMDKVKSVSGTRGTFEMQLGDQMRSKIEPVNKLNVYKKEFIWTVNKGKLTTFTSRPLGIKLLFDSGWKFSVYDYQKQESAFILNPPSIKSKQGKEIHFTLAIFMRVANKDDQLEDYVKKFIAKFPSKRMVKPSGKYSKMIVWEIEDNTKYKEMGGGRLHMVGVERVAPAYPGLLLENPVDLPTGEPGQVAYYRASTSKDRFKGRIFYIFMLDTSEDIDEESLAIFNTLINEQIIIE